MNFEKISKYVNDDTIHLPVRKTKDSAGYDFECSEDIIIPSYAQQMNRMLLLPYDKGEILTLKEIQEITKQNKLKPTLIPTGIKAQIDQDHYLQLSVRSSCPLKSWIILANGVGIIDADYYNNPDNEGEIFFQVINLTPYDILLKKGETIGQGVILPYVVTDTDESKGARVGGFGSTDE